MARVSGQLVLAVVAADTTGETAVIGAALDILDCAHGLDAAERAGSIERRGHAVLAVDRAAAADALAMFDPAAQREVHRALAEALEGSLVPRRVVRRAEHLVQAAWGIDPAAADAAEAAAIETERAGDLPATAEWWACAARLSSGPADVARRLTASCKFHWLSAAFEPARELGAEALAVAPTSSLRADAAILVGQLELWERGPQRCLDVLMPLSEEVAPDDPDRAALLLVHAANATVLSGDTRIGLEHAERAVTLAALGDGSSVIPAQLALGFVLTMRGDHHGADLALAPIRQLASGLLDSGIPEVDHLLNVLGMLDTITERWTTAEAFLERVVSRGRAEGTASMLGMTSAILAELHWRTGRWDQAWALATGPMADGALQPVTLAWSQAFLGHLAAAFGRRDECRAWADLALSEAALLDAPVIAAWAHAALGLLELGEGHAGTAAVHLDRVAAFAATMEQREPGALWWQADHVEALWRAGRRHEAARSLADFDLTIHDGHVAAAAIAARCHGVVAEDDATAEAAFARGIELLAERPAPFELARLLACRAERRAGAGHLDTALADLDEATSIFDALGAAPWLHRALELRQRLEGHPVSDLGTLSSAEMRVALSVSRGLTNREVAAELFLSVKTVDFHLQRIYRKLGVRSRTELALRVTSGGEEPAAP